VLLTILPNKERKGSTYSTQDNVFIPSTTELGDRTHINTYQIGAVYPYFHNEFDAKRIALSVGDTRYYWTRSPDDFSYSFLKIVSYGGRFGNAYAWASVCGVRPALNLKSEILVSEIRN
jgi:hypothetical protein